MHITRRTLKEDYEELVEALRPLQETFIKKEDPSIFLAEFLEAATLCLSRVKRTYNKSARNRQAAVAPTLRDVKKLKALVAKVEKQLQAQADGDVDPEDANMR